MNHLLSPISWTSYIEGCALALFIYYLIIGVKHYAADARHFARKLSGSPDQSGQLTAALLFEEPLHNTASLASGSNQVNYENQPDTSMQEADNLILQLKATIADAAQKPFAPANLVTQLRKIYKEHMHLKNSPHREAINELVVGECERTGTALLTEEETDQWWSD